MPRIRNVVISAIAALAFASVPATAAFAGNYPSPSPTPTATLPVVRVQNWTFDGQSSDIGSILPTLVNRVDGQGALPFQNWRIRDLSANVSVFQLGGNSITLWHSAQPLPTFNFGTCTALFGPKVGFFRILNATGIFAGVRSARFGQFVEEGLVSIPFRFKYGRAVCPLVFSNPWAVRLAVIQNAINGVNGPVAGQLPTLVDFSLQGNGAVVLPVIPTPCPTGGGGIFAPVAPSTTPSTVSPTTTAWRGQPNPTCTPVPSYS